MCKWLYTLLTFWLALGTAQARFEFTPTAREAYEQALSMRLDEARLTIAQLKRQDADNLIAYHIENYIDFLNLYFNQNEATYKNLKKNEALRLEKIQQGSPDSPYYLYTQADVRLQWALVKLQFGEYLSAFNDISKAHKLLQKNQEKFPDFLPNLKNLGVLHALAGTIPDHYRWGVRLLGGLTGSVAQGRRELNSVLQKAQQQDFVFKTETAVILANILLYLESDGEGAWQVLKKVHLEPAKNPLHCFVLANVAMRSGRNDTAIELLQNRPQGGYFTKVVQLDFMLGLAKLRRLETDASVYFQRFLQQRSGQNGIKEAYQKLAWCELLKSNQNGYRAYLKTAITQGKAATGADKNALQEAQSGKTPEVTLLKARLLFDGGYLQKAHQQLQTKSSADFKDQAGRLEYFYRMGRILHGLEQWDEALGFYQRTIRQGQNEPYFYACNAALQAGLICEKQKNFPRAQDFYKTCLRLSPSEYKTELHQKAKSGLGRLGD